MFGYVVVNKPELKFREFDEYRGFYCGLCQSLRKHYGISGQMILNYDLTFLAIVLTALYETETEKAYKFCGLHPFHKQMKYENECIDYCADMTIILGYYKCLDDWDDDKKPGSKVELGLIKQSFERVKMKYPDKIELIDRVLNKTHELEKANNRNVDEIANLTGKMLACIYEYKDDEWKKTLSEMGYFLGKFIYMMDAYEDVDEDLKHHHYNVYSEKSKEENFEAYMQESLEMMMAQCTSYFEILPILDYAEILRNILYSGIWTKREMILKKKGEISDGKSL